MNEIRLSLQNRIKDFFLYESPNKKFNFNLDGKKAGKIFGSLKERLNYASKWLKNHSYYTVCMKGHEDAIDIFRICNEEIKGIECYDKLKIKKLLYIKLRSRNYMICPDAFRAWSQEDFEKNKLG